MRQKTILVSFVALFAVVLAISMVAAANFVDNVEVEVNGLDASTSTPTIAGFPSEVVPVEVEFKAIQDTSDVRVKVFIEGYKNEISEITSRFHIVDGSKYIERFSIKLPSTLDLDDLTEDLNLVVRFSAKGETAVEFAYAIKMQRDQYGLGFLSIEAPKNVAVGETIAIEAVVENNGNEKLENIYFKASIPDLGITRRVYVGDLDEQDERDFIDDRSINRHDTKVTRAYLQIPSNVPTGTYDVELELYNYDTGVVVKRTITIGSVQTSILPVSTSNTVAKGQTATYDVVLVNPNNRLVVYTITPEESTGLIINIAEPIVAVPADSSRTVKVSVKPTDDATEGTHIVRVNVNSEAGLVDQVTLTANVEGKSSAVRNDAVFVLTVILVIVFVVLLVILIVLLTKRSEEEPEELGETSYY